MPRHHQPLRDLLQLSQNPREWMHPANKSSQLSKLSFLPSNNFFWVLKRVKPEGGLGLPKPRKEHNKESNAVLSTLDHSVPHRSKQGSRGASSFHGLSAQAVTPEHRREAPGAELTKWPHCSFQYPAEHHPGWTAALEMEALHCGCKASAHKPSCSLPSPPGCKNVWGDDRRGLSCFPNYFHLCCFWMLADEQIFDVIYIYKRGFYRQDGITTKWAGKKSRKEISWKTKASVGGQSQKNPLEQPASSLSTGDQRRLLYVPAPEGETGDK